MSTGPPQHPALSHILATLLPSGCTQQHWVWVGTTSLLLQDDRDCCHSFAPPASASAPTAGWGAEGGPGITARSMARCSSRGKGPLRKCSCRDSTSNRQSWVSRNTQTHTHKKKKAACNYFGCIAFPKGITFEVIH